MALAASSRWSKHCQDCVKVHLLRDSERGTRVLLVGKQRLLRGKSIVKKEREGVKEGGAVGGGGEEEEVKEISQRRGNVGND